MSLTTRKWKYGDGNRDKNRTCDCNWALRVVELVYVVHKWFQRIVKICE